METAASCKSEMDGMNSLEALEGLIASRLPASSAFTFTSNLKKKDFPLRLFFQLSKLPKYYFTFNKLIHYFSVSYFQIKT